MSHDIDMLRLCLTTPGALTPVVVGAPGIGKSQRVKALATSLGWDCEVLSPGERGEGAFGVVPVPNGDGYLLYPGPLAGHPGPVSSVRLEQAREGVEDYEYLYLLKALIAKAKAAGKDTLQAEQAMAQANRLVIIPNAGGRYSSKILPDPEAVYAAKEAVAKAIEVFGK